MNGAKGIGPQPYRIIGAEIINARRQANMEQTKTIRNSGFLKVTRESHWIEQAGAEIYGAWMLLLKLAAFKNCSIMTPGGLVRLKRGQILTTLRDLADLFTGSSGNRRKSTWTKDRVGRFLERLKQEGETRQQTRQRKTLITICNYEEWQGQTNLDRDNERDKELDRDKSETRTRQGLPSGRANLDEEQDLNETRTRQTSPRMGINRGVDEAIRKEERKNKEYINTSSDNTKGKSETPTNASTLEHSHSPLEAPSAPNTNKGSDRPGMGEDAEQRKQPATFLETIERVKTKLISSYGEQDALEVYHDILREHGFKSAKSATKKRDQVGLYRDLKELLPDDCVTA
jgi:hypothetical protein